MKCTIPPPGWYCTRKAPHDGPCAALPTDPEQFRAMTEGTFNVETFLYAADNYREAKAFLGERGFAKCKKCDGSGEYETNYGPVGCQPCNSRLIAVQTSRGVRYADYGDRIVKNIDGTFYIAFAEETP